jgi:hypothetical protein
MEAIYHDLNVTTSSGINKPAYLAYIKTVGVLPHWNASIEAASLKCTEEVPTKRLPEIDGGKCNPVFFAILTCTMMEAFTVCPKEAWTADAKCETLKTWVKACGNDTAMIMKTMSKKKPGK